MTTTTMVFDSVLETRDNISDLLKTLANYKNTPVRIEINLPLCEVSVSISQDAVLERKATDDHHNSSQSR